MYIQWPWGCLTFEVMFWAIAIPFCTAATVGGLASFFFADRIFDWNIRLLQSRSYRTLHRYMSLALVFIAVAYFLFGWAFATGSFH
jgi:hypothetical protein